MNSMKYILGEISGGHVLDVATGNGGFIHELISGLKDYDDILGIDIKEKAKSAFVESFKGNPKVHFRLMDAEKPEFSAASFDTVCISNSLHHFKDPRLVLTNMSGILRPGGSLIISEMYRDGQSEVQMTHVLLHHWWGAVDRMNGIFHNETYLRQELVDLVNGLGFEIQKVGDISDIEQDPKDPEVKLELDPVIEMYIQRAEGDAGLQSRGNHLRQRLDEIGFQSASTLVMVAKKPDHPG